LVCLSADNIITGQNAASAGKVAELVIANQSFGVRVTP
jgi:hypothetical protein